MTSSVQAQREILRQTAILRSVADAIPAKVAVADRDGRYRFVNDAFARARGATAAELIGRNARDVLGTHEFERRLPWMRRALAGETVSFELDDANHGAVEYKSLTYIPVRLADGEFEGFVSVVQDISAQKREASRLLDLAHRDALTGLFNRSGFEQALFAMKPEADAPGVGLLYVDLDHFKPINDRHGHPIGDKVLEIFAKRVLNLVRPSDTVARLGGDEFAVALTGLRSLRDAEVVAEKVLAAARMPLHVGDLLLQIGASIGVAFNDRRDEAWAELVTRADHALLRAKAGGRGRSVSDGG